MAAVSLEEVQARLPQLIDQLAPGEEIVITRDEKPVALLTAPATPAVPERKLGSLRGSVLYMAPDFDAPLDDFKEYME